MEVALQYMLLVCDMMLDMLPQVKLKFTPTIQKCGDGKVQMVWGKVSWSGFPR